MKYTTQLLFEFIKNNKLLFIIDIIYLIIIPVNEILLPHIYGKAVEAIQNNKSFFSLLWWTISVLIIVKCAQTLHDLHSTHSEPKLETYIRKKLVDNVIDTLDGNYKDMPIGDIITNINSVPRVITKWFTSIKDYITPYTISFLIQNIYFFIQDYLIGIVLFISLLTIICFIILSPLLCKNAIQEKQNKSSAMYQSIEDVLNNLISIFSGRNVNEEKENLHRKNDEFKKAYSTTMRCALNFKVISLPIMLAFLITFVIRSNFLLKNGRMTSATFISLFAMILSTTSTLNWFVDIIREIIYNTGILNSVSNHLKLNINTVFNTSECNISNEDIILSSKEITVELKNSKKILDNVSINVKNGERVGIIGNIGSGKSTLLKVLCGLITPNTGCIYIDNNILSKQSSIGYVPQHPILFNRSLYDNLVYGNSKVKKNDVLNFLNRYDILKELNNFPLYDLVGKNGSYLSGGQRQLVYCIREILKTPSVLIMDEPTSSMSNNIKKLLMTIISENIKAVIVVTHDITLKNFCTRVIAMENGKFVL
jgi:ABC-type multidrug transport system fused ATPase/permease subunit